MEYTVIEAASRLSREQKPFIYTVILKTEGSASRNNGSMVVETDGTFHGTIGGGELEAYALSQALGMLASGQKQRHLSFSIDQGGVQAAGTVYLYLLSCTLEEERTAFIRLRQWEEAELDHVLGLQLQPQSAILGLCEGGATIGDVHPRFLETAKKVLEEKKPVFLDTPAWTCHLSLPVNHHSLLLVGGGHVNQAIAQLAHFAGLPVQVVETREAFATKELFPHARTIVVQPTLKEAFSQVSTNCHTACIIASHAFDQEAAHDLLARTIAYLGVLGSRHKAKILHEKLNLPPETRETLFCPIGLDLGSETPQEIAISVLSEVMKVFNKRSGNSLRNQASRLVVVRGGGDLATGVIIRLHRAGYRVIVLEIDKPSVIRRTVSFAEAMFSGEITVEGVTAKRVESVKQAFSALEDGFVPILCDPSGATLGEINPICIVDAIIAKRNLGTRITDAPLVIALGPGFDAGVDCDAVIETKRGHSLGRIIRKGSALPNSGIPGIIEGFGEERVLHSTTSGVFFSTCAIGDLVTKGQVIAKVGEEDVIATIDGKLRGLLHNGLSVPPKFKIADIDPRSELADHTTISEKAMAIAGSVLEVLDGFLHNC
nr:selenium-dependent molybdenum cofactor biosynthesis protein YqeB [uncultured Sphaerochaeta sp.]